MIATLMLAAAAAGFACRDLSDPEGRRWFQDEPCAVGYVHDPLPPVPVFRDAEELAGSLATTEGPRVRWGHRRGPGHRHGGHGGKGRYK